MIIWLTSQKPASDKPSFEGLGIVKKKKMEGFNHMASSGTLWLLKWKEIVKGEGPLGKTSGPLSPNGWIIGINELYQPQSLFVFNLKTRFDWDLKL